MLNFIRNTYLRLVRSLAYGLSILAIISSLFYGPSIYAQKLNDDELYLAMRVTVGIHDAGIPIGLLPFPATQLAGETLQYVGNIGLKAYRPYLTRPKAGAPFDMDFYVNADGDADRCSFHFYLPNSTAEYENMFGIIPIRSPYYDTDTNRDYLWQDRWGVLPPPRIYHANSTARLSVRSASPVRRYDETLGGFTEPYYPILDAYSPLQGGAVPKVLGIRQPARADQDGQPEVTSSQEVYLPIGEHAMEWTAATQLNVVTDIVVPGVLLAFAVHSEIKTARAGVKAAKKVKEAGGIADDIVDQADNVADSINTQLAKRKFDSIWEGLLTRKKPGPIGSQIKTALCKKIVGSVALPLLSKAINYGITRLEVDTGDYMYLQHWVSSFDRDFINIIYEVSRETALSLYIDDLKGWIATSGCDADGDDVPFGMKVILKLLEASILEQFVVYDTGISTIGQRVRVWDNVPPTWESPLPQLTLEATDFGGTRRYRAVDTMRAAVEPLASDNCGRQPILSSDAPELLPIGETFVTWTAKDQGPNPNDGQDYAPTAVQTIIVEDTQPPLLLVPPSKVIESNADVSLVDAAIGDAVAIDLADQQPTISNNAPANFLVGHRNEVQWTAKDDSDNQAQDIQWITVKSIGSNNTPTAYGATAQTLTAKAVPITLIAQDNDVLDGRPDPLWFKISNYPQHGEFIAPLYPFFIADYRTGAQDGLGSGFDPEIHEVYSYISTNYCEAQLTPPLDFVHEALFVHVTDDGIRYVLDQFFTCDDENKAVTGNRISKWDRDGNFLGQMRFGPNPEDAPHNDAFVLDRDGFIYYNQYTSSGSSSEMFLNRCSTEFVGNNGQPDASTAELCSGGWKFENSTHPDDQLDVARISYIRIDSSQDVAYIADQDDVFAFGLVVGASPHYLGELGPTDDNGVLADWLGTAPGMEVGADGSLYVVDSEYHRIHKFAPPTHDEAGNFVPGAYIGWAGRCTTSGNKACDEVRDRSRGYSCTYAVDSCVVGDGQLAGAGQGQFNTPKYLTLDPNDVLYVADYENERIQRFSPDGTFAGEAVSDGSGINKGDRPSFVLGNMGKPQSLSVNSSQFFVVDRDEQFVHIFGTLPFKDITNNVETGMATATVTYVSDQDFHSDTDSFGFTVSDGLVDSVPATVSITVERNYRPPIALAAALDTNEDAALVITLTGDDPDGIIGKDFNGLDTLTFAVTAQPGHGQLSGSNANWTYTPDPDYYGEDEIRFTVNDGVFTSDPASVTITVLPVNDPPVITLEAPTRVARGFPLTFNATFTDDPSDSYEGELIWGDGSTDTTGGIVDDNGENPRIEGVAISAPPLPEQEGRAFAVHTFDTTGAKSMQLCLTDSDLADGCDSIGINVEELVSLGVGATVYAEPLAEGEILQSEIADDVPFKYELTIVNGQPSSYAGLTAANVNLSGVLPTGLNIHGIEITKGTCSRTGTALSCTLGSLSPGEEVTLTVNVQGPGNLIFSEDRDFSGELTTTTSALEEAVSFYVSTQLIGDATDSDGDGMTDVFESAYGLNPSQDDANADPDGDGLTNLEEFDAHTSPINADSDGDGLSDYQEVLQGSDPLRDDVPPVLTSPGDITVNATGALTAVALGTVTASDYKDGALTPIASNPGPFAPGAHSVIWSATDAAGNKVEATQNVKVVPMVSFAVDRTVTEGTTVQAVVELNGPAVTYPVTVPYIVSGSALNPSDHNAVSGEIQIDAGINASIVIDIVKDNVAESDESLVLTMGTPTNAVFGAKNTHTTTIVERNLAPMVTISAEQQGKPRTTIATDAGVVSISAAVQDSVADSHSYDWSASDAGVMDSMDYTDESYLINPIALNNGIYGVRVQVTDDGIPIASTNVSTLLKVVSASPVLDSDVDSDGDGVSDADEGAGDSDGDRVPDYLDDLPHTNMLRMSDDGRVLETNTGLQLRLGPTVFERGGIYSVLAEATLEEEADYGYPNGVVDFELTGIESGTTAQVVYPLKRPLPVNSVYRKYMNGSWRDFVVDNNNALSSAPGQQGACPPPGSNLYELGLTVGHGCIQLTLEDGGPNDADNEANGSIQDPGGLAVPVGVNLELLTVADQTVSTGSEPVVMHLRLSTDSGEVELSSLTLQASGSADDRTIIDVKLIVDSNANGLVDDTDEIIANGQFDQDNGTLNLNMLQPYEIPVGDTDLLVTLVL
jgi:hypothetical protein